MGEFCQGKPQCDCISFIQYLASKNKPISYLTVLTNLSDLDILCATIKGGLRFGHLNKGMKARERDEMTGSLDQKLIRSHLDDPKSAPPHGAISEMNNTIKQLKVWVYKLVFTDGSIYIGRTHNRYGKCFSIARHNKTPLGLRLLADPQAQVFTLELCDGYKQAYHAWNKWRQTCTIHP